jgi:D-glycero-D-manno-heptose 1,7-bisphosphate phosphatase
MKEYIIITNQSGIGSGFFSKSKFHIFNDEILRILKTKGVNIAKKYYCPRTPDDQCNSRKPKIGMINQAMEDFDIDLKIH